MAQTMCTHTHNDARNTNDRLGWWDWWKKAQDTSFDVSWALVCFLFYLLLISLLICSFFLGIDYPWHNTSDAGCTTRHGTSKAGEMGRMSKTRHLTCLGLWYVVFKLLILFLVTTSAHNTRASHTNTCDPRDHDPLVACERSTHRIRQEHTTMTDDGLGLELWGPVHRTANQTGLDCFLDRSYIGLSWSFQFNLRRTG